MTPLGPTVALLFAIGLLASGLASTSVDAYAGAMIMAGLLKTFLLLLRRLVTLVPALGVSPSASTRAGRWSSPQVVLSGIPGAGAAGGLTANRGADGWTSTTGSWAPRVGVVSYSAERGPDLT